MYMEVVDVTILPLGSKHYSTDLEVVVCVDGLEYTMKVSISGYAPTPSYREVLKGYEPDYGMDHVESETHLKLAHIFAKALADLKGLGND